MKNALRLYKIMLQHWGFLISGVFFMLGFAVFSGVGVTMVIPLFDYVFGSRDKSKIAIDDLPEFFAGVKKVFHEITESADGLISQVMAIFNDATILEKFKELLAATDPLFLLYLICGTLIAITILKNIFFYCNQVMFANLRGKTILALRNIMFEKYLRQSLAFFNVNKVGDSIVRIDSDVNVVNDQLIFPTFNILRDSFLIIVYVSIALSLNAKLFLISLIALPIFSVFVNYVGHKIKKYANRIQQQFSNMFSNIEEVFNNMRIVKAFSREDFELEKFKLINRKYFVFWRKSIIYSSINVPLSELNGTIIGVIIIFLGGSLVLSPHSTLSSGEFITFLLAVFSLLHPIKELTRAYADIRRAQVSLERIFIILNQKSELIDDPHPVEKKTFDKNIVLNNVSFSYNNSAEVLKGISLEVKKGEKIAFVGSSGSGKTTLINLLPRNYDVTAGQILIDDTDIRKIKLKDLRNLFGMVTQDSILFSDTIAYNISYGTLKKVNEKDIKEAARIGYADEFIEELPRQYDEMLYQKGSNLSGGQKQRLCIARAVIGNPPILIFDEATSALDTESEKKVQQAINQATQNRTVLVIAHRLSTILSADKIVVLDRGKIVGIGKHRELLKNCKRYQILYHLQFEDSAGNEQENVEAV